MNGINIIREMHTTQINIEPETGEERNDEAVRNTHQYNIWPRSTKINPKYALTQINNQLIMPKPHAHKNIKLTLNRA